MIDNSIMVDNVLKVMAVYIEIEIIWMYFDFTTLNRLYFVLNCGLIYSNIWLSRIDEKHFDNVSKMIRLIYQQLYQSDLQRSMLFAQRYLDIVLRFGMVLVSIVFNVIYLFCYHYLILDKKKRKLHDIEYILLYQGLIIILNFVGLWFCFVQERENKNVRFSTRARQRLEARINALNDGKTFDFNNNQNVVEVIHSYLNLSGRNTALT